MREVRRIGLSATGFAVIGLMLSGCGGQAREDLAVKDANRIEIYTSLAAQALAQNNLDVALAEAKRAIKVDSGNSQANDIMALVQARLRDDVRAEKHFQRALAADDRNSDAHNNFGVFLCERGRIDEAIPHFDAALTNPLYKTPVRANLNAAQCLLKKADYKGAERYYRAALTVDARSSVALFSLARLTYDRQDYLATRAFLTRYFEGAKDSPEALLLAVKAERALGSNSNAADFKFRLRSKFPDSAEAKLVDRIN